MTEFIYVITNDINGKQYVGKTTDTIEKRFKTHLEEYQKFRCEKRPLYAAMNKYGIEHFSVQQLEECDLTILNKREQYWIKQLNTFHNGYNATLGGEGTQLYDYDMFIKEYNEGLTIEEISFIHQCDVGTIRKILVKNNIDTKANANKKNVCIPVVQLDLNNNILQDFISSHEAARWIQNNHFTTDKSFKSVGSRILQVANGKRKTAYGFKWKLKENN